MLSQFHHIAPTADGNSDEDSELNGEENVTVNDNHGDCICSEKGMTNPTDDPSECKPTSFSSGQVQPIVDKEKRVSNAVYSPYI